MLSVAELDQIGSFMVSEAVTVKGPQLLAVLGLLQRLDQEKRLLMVAQRVTPGPVAAPVDKAA